VNFRETARKAARVAYDTAFQANYENEALSRSNAVDGIAAAADAASDVWEPVVQRLEGALRAAKVSQHIIDSIRNGE
jgi:hypothetical protein